MDTSVVIDIHGKPVLLVVVLIFITKLDTRGTALFGASRRACISRADRCVLCVRILHLLRSTTSLRIIVMHLPPHLRRVKHISALFLFVSAAGKLPSELNDFKVISLRRPVVEYSSRLWTHIAAYKLRPTPSSSLRELCSGGVHYMCAICHFNDSTLVLFCRLYLLLSFLLVCFLYVVLYCMFF